MSTLMEEGINRNRFISDVMHALVHNGILFTVIVMCLVHAGLLGATWWLGVTHLAFFNVLSVTVYLFSIFLCKAGFILPVFFAIPVEVCAYAAVSVHYSGWECGSYYFMFSIVPIVIYFGCFIFKGTRRLLIAGVLALIFAAFAVLYFMYSDATPVYAVSEAGSRALLIYSSFVMFFSMVFYSAIYIYASEMVRSDLEQANEQLSADAQNDALTGLLNRRGFLPVIGALMDGDPRHHFCIAFSDIDNFKRINDSYGHDCGDEVLRHVAKMIKKEMLGCAICRWGGEEMVILMRDYDLAVAKQKMEYLRKSIETTPTLFYNQRINITVTIGLEEYRDTYHDPEEIIKVADERMYQGKQHGKNMCVWEDLEKAS